MYRFSHALVRETILEELSLTDKVRAHAAVAQALETMYGAEERQAHAAELLAHFTHAQTLLGGSKVAEYALVAGRAGLSSGAFEQAYAFCSQGLEAVRGTPMDDTQAELHLQAGLVQAWRGIEKPAREHFERAMAYWESTGSGNRMVRELARPELIMAIQWLAIADRVLPYAEPGSREEALLLAAEGFARTRGQRDKPWREPLDRALQIVAHDPDPTTGMVVHHFYGWACVLDGLWQEDIDHSLEGIRLAEQAGNHLYESMSRLWVVEGLRSLGRIEEAGSQSERMREEAERHGDRWYLRAALAELLEQAWTAGDLGGLRTIGGRSRDEAKRMGLRRGCWEYLRHVELELLAGNEEEARRYLAEVVSAAREPGAADPGMGSNAAACLVTVATLTRDHRDLELARALALESTASLHVDATVLFVARCALAMVVSLRGDREEAAKLYEERGWWMSRQNEGGILPPGSIARLALLLGRSDEAIERFRRGLEAARTQVPARLWSSYELGQALLERGAPGDRAEALTMLEGALELARSKDLRLMVRLLEESLAPQTGSPPAGLTAREIETLRLLAAGKTDKEIAFELHITVKTASNHVGNILRKIGAGNRTEAARYAMKHGFAE